jgi:L-fuconolactonase
LSERAGDLNIEKIVFVQADARAEEGLPEAEWVESLARLDPRVQGIVAFAPLEEGGAVRDYLERLIQFPHVKGVRRLIQSEGPGFAVQPDFVKGVKLLKEFDLSFDICIKHHQLADTITLVKQCPEINFILDHVAKPDIAAGLMEPWGSGISELAAMPNVVCKISGMVTEADHDNWTRDDLKPYIDHIIASFGIDRVMYGSDWPVQALAADYPQWVEVLTWATSDLSRDEQDKLFYRNALAVYRL